MQHSLLAEKRRSEPPQVPHILQDLSRITFIQDKPTTCVGNEAEIASFFPQTFGRPVLLGSVAEKKAGRALRVGVVFSGGQASGGHNVIAALFDALKSFHPDSRLLGFLDGPSGIISCKSRELTAKEIAPFRNQGGFDLLGSGRTKIETREQLEASWRAVENLALDGLVIIGGDDSNTNAAILAEYFLAKGCKTCVIGIPKTIDGDLQNAYLAVSFGFDTACKTYIEMLGNIGRDALSAKKYYHFVKLMGRSASHIALECALKVAPNGVLISEEIEAENHTLAHIISSLADLICARALQGKNYGVILIPEGVIECIHEMKLLFKELGKVGSGGKEKLSPNILQCFESLPELLQKQLLLTRDPHGNVNVSAIETEKFIIACVEKELKEREAKGLYKGKFYPLSHFFGYEGRSGLPSHFDSNYCYALGLNAALMIREQLTGYMSCILHLSQPVTRWSIAALPLTMFMHIEMRKGEKKPVIRKTLVDLKDKPYQEWLKQKKSCALEDEYTCMGPIQFYGDEELTHSIPQILK